MLDTFLAALTLQASSVHTIVVLAVAALGGAAGLVGTFLVLARRALVGDALAHATLPGICLAFLLAVALGFGKSLPLLLAGALATGFLGVVTVNLLMSRTRLTQDTAIGAVLSVFYAGGVVLLTVIQQLPVGGQAGLKSFILGQAAATTAGEAWGIGAMGLLLAAVTALLFKELRLVTFDRDYARVQGWPVGRLEGAVLALGALVVVVGLSTVGLVLVLALLILPAAAARFWTDRLSVLLPLAGVFGAGGAWVGAALSAAARDLPSGAVIVLCLGALFVLSLLLAPCNGALGRLLRRLRQRRRLAAARWLVAADAQLRGRGPDPGPPPADLPAMWRGADGALTEAGRAAAEEAARTAALWDLFFRRHAARAPAIDRSLWGVAPVATALGPDWAAHLEAELASEGGPP